MNIFGVGGAELIAILVIMLVFAGPKRMIHWSYVLGQYVAKFRVIWSQTVDLVQKEFDEAGVDIKLPKEPPTRQNLNRSLGEAMKPMTKPIQDSIDEVKKDVDTLQDVSDSLNNKTSKKADSATSKTPAADTGVPENKTLEASEAPEPTAAKTPKARAAPVEATPSSMGSWSGDGAAEAGAPNANGKAADLGTWSAKAVDE
ncbi:MAG: hypothetical protein OXE52_08620 [Chloroflexi bacterium]|nr:hypothetical protein [Chloroflexota bacterium]